MSEPSRPRHGAFDALGQRVASGFDTSEPTSQRQLDQRARLVAWEEQRARQSYGFLAGNHARVWWALSAAVGVLVVAWGIRFLPAESGARAALQGQLSLTIAEQHALTENAWITADAEPQVLRFSEGSQIVIAPGSKLRVAALDATGLRLSLESGQVEATITPESGYRWVIQAGPHRVTVLGTVFSVSWLPEEHRLDVNVRRGRVQVTSSQPDQAERVLEAGDKLTITPPERAEAVGAEAQPDVSRVESGSVIDPSERIETGELTETGKVGPVDGAPAEARSMALSRKPARVQPRDLTAERVPSEPSAAEPSAAESASSLAPARPSLAVGEWKKLAQGGQYAQAVAAAERQGVSSLLQSASASELLLLADAARLSSAANIAEQALLAIRGRYPSHPNASVAAFALGRLAFEVRRDDRSAIRWFTTYLQAEPSGAMAEGARGRLLMTWLRLGDRAAAKKSAQQYLLHHPKGRHASVAQSLLSD